MAHTTSSTFALCPTLSSSSLSALLRLARCALTSAVGFLSRTSSAALSRSVAIRVVRASIECESEAREADRVRVERSASVMVSGVDEVECGAANLMTCSTGEDETHQSLAL